MLSAWTTSRRISERGDAKQTRFIRIDEPADGNAGVIERYVQQAIAQRLLG
jgi:hypothetical protein